MTQEGQQRAEYDYSKKQIIWAMVAIFAVYGAGSYIIQTLNVARPKMAAELNVCVVRFNPRAGWRLCDAHLRQDVGYLRATDYADGVACLFPDWHNSQRHQSHFYLPNRGKRRGLFRRWSGDAPRICGRWGHVPAGKTQQMDRIAQYTHGDLFSVRADAGWLVRG